MGKPPVRAIEARRLKVTPELLANIRHRYEHTPESLSTMAADLGCSGQTVCNIAKREGWVRYVPPPRDLTSAARLLARAEKLVSSPLIPAQAGIQGQDGEAGGLSPGSPLSRGRADIEATPTPTLPLSGGGSGEALAGGGEEEKIADTAEALHDAARKLLADVEASRAQLAGLPQSPIDQERTARTLANLTATLQKLSPLRCGVARSEGHTDHDYDDMPADIDEFRNELARRIRAFVASRTDRGDAGGDAAQPVDSPG